MTRENKKENPTASKKPLTKAAEAKLREKEAQKRTRNMDRLKLALAVIVAAVGIYGYYALPGQTELVRMLPPIIGVAIALLMVFFWCDFGRRLLVYIRESTQELKKVVWPDKQSTTRMTMMVIAFVAVLVLFLALADWLISWVLFDLFLNRGA